MTILLDSNVIIDLLTDSRWSDWVAGRLEELAHEEFAINPLIYAEVSIPYPSVEELDADLARLYLTRLDLPWEAAFVAGRAFHQYKRARGSTKTAPLPDFYIGAHAQVGGHTLLTRDAPRYRTYFPEVRLIAP